MGGGGYAGTVGTQLYIVGGGGYAGTVYRDSHV